MSDEVVIAVRDNPAHPDAVRPIVKARAVHIFLNSATSFAEIALRAAAGFTEGICPLVQYTAERLDIDPAEMKITGR